MRIPVSHAFHTTIVEPASVPLVATLRRLDVQPPRIPIVANVTGDFYPSDATSETMLEYLGKQVSSPVQFVQGLRTLYDAGARVFVEVGPEACPARLRRRRARRPRRRRRTVHEPPEARRPGVAQPGPVRPVGRRHRIRRAGRPRRRPPAATGTSWSAAPSTARPRQRARRRSHHAARSTVRRGDRTGAAHLRRGARRLADACTGAVRAADGGRSLDGARSSITGAALGLPGVERVFDDDEHRPHPGRPAVHHAGPERGPRADGRHAHHPAAQDRRAAEPASRRSTTLPTS